MDCVIGMIFKGCYYSLEVIHLIDDVVGGFASIENSVGPVSAVSIDK
ncbi:hypothetical protein [Salipaludibacillus keqinensis]|nr:hypothetical protein [Salipaludibacillus keqinensis]